MKEYSTQSEEGAFRSPKKKAEIYVLYYQKYNVISSPYNEY